MGGGGLVWRRDQKQVAPPKPAPHPEAPSAPAPVSQPFPFLRIPGGGFTEADPKAALKRQSQQALATVAPRLLGEPGFRGPSQLPDGAPAREVAEAVQAAIERQEALSLPGGRSPRPAEEHFEAMNRQREVALAEAREALRQRLVEAQVKRIQQLGGIVRLVAGRFAGVPPDPKGGGLDTTA